MVWPAGPRQFERLELRDFRNYAHVALRARAPAPIVLHGDNGAGKTNLLEAVSLLSPGRGLRGAKLAEIDRSDGGALRLRANVDGHLGPERDRDRPRPRRRAPQRAWPTASRCATRMRWASIVSLLWLTPAMDRLFAEGAAGRRRFLDRLVLAIDAAHAARVAAFERASRERSHLLRAGRRDAAWLGAIEQRIAEAAVAVTAARRELVADLDGELARAQHHFPRPRLVLVGELESWLDEMPALGGRAAAGGLAGRRVASEDAQSGSTAVGPHRSDLVANDALRGEAAARCSTGRQKAYLISVVLAQAQLRLRRHGDLPILLLDEVTAHLDPRRRIELLARAGRSRRAVLAHRHRGPTVRPHACGWGTSSMSSTER